MPVDNKSNITTTPAVPETSATKTQVTGTNADTPKSHYDNAHKGKRWQNRHYQKPHVSGFNDISWYAHNALLLKDAASFPFSTALGLPVKPCNLSSTQVTDLSRRLPGVMVLVMTHIPGMSSDYTSPVNMAARDIYSFVRHMNSGHSNYDSPDLMMYLLAVAECYSFFGNMLRAYGCLQYYNNYNRYLPRAICAGSGFDYDNLNSNLAQFRYYINVFAAKLKALCVPNNLDYFKRSLWLYSGEYNDDETMKGQVYMYAPDSFGWYDATQSQTGGGITYHRWGDENELVDVTDFGDSMINALLSDEDIGIISGDIKKAYGDNLFDLDAISSDLTLVPQYIPEVLQQIHNTQRFLNGAFKVSQADNIIKCEVVTTQDFEIGDGVTPILDLMQQSPTPEDVVIATRNTIVTRNNGGNTTVISCGDTVCNYVRIYYYNNSGSLVNVPFTGTVVKYKSVDITAAQAAIEQDTLQHYMLASNFDYAPVTYVFTDYVLATQACSWAGIIGNVTNYYAIGEDDLSRLHEMVLLSLFNVPNRNANSTYHNR